MESDARKRVRADLIRTSPHALRTTVATIALTVAIGLCVAACGSDDERVAAETGPPGSDKSIGVSDDWSAWEVGGVLLLGFVAVAAIWLLVTRRRDR